MQNGHNTTCANSNTFGVCANCWKSQMLWHILFTCYGHSQNPKKMQLNMEEEIKKNKQTNRSRRNEYLGGWNTLNRTQTQHRKKCISANALFVFLDASLGATNQYNQPELMATAKRICKNVIHSRLLGMWMIECSAYNTNAHYIYWPHSQANQVKLWRKKLNVFVHVPIRPLHGLPVNVDQYERVRVPVPDSVSGYLFPQPAPDPIDKISGLRTGTGSDSTNGYGGTNTGGDSINRVGRGLGKRVPVESSSADDDRVGFFLVSIWNVLVQ